MLGDVKNSREIVRCRYFQAAKSSIGSVIMTLENRGRPHFVGKKIGSAGQRNWVSVLLLTTFISVIINVTLGLSSMAIV